MSRGNSRSHNNSWIGYCRLSRTMITGYKKKKLGHPSDKMSGDVPRAGWRAVIVSEILFPIFMAILFIIAYLFVKSFPGTNGKQPPAALIRIAVISLGPIVWNAAILLVFFMVSLFLGPVLDPRFPLFGATMASMAHVLAIVGMVGFFEFLVRDSFALFGLSNITSIVVPRIMGCFARGIRPHHCHCRSARCSQGVDLCLPFSRVQARRDESSLVDRKVVWSWSWQPCHITARSRVHREDCRIVALEF